MCIHTQVDAKCQQIQERAERREQELSCRVISLEEAGIQAENQVKELKETIFELEDQVEQQRAVNCHTNQAVLDMESMFISLAAQFSVVLWSLNLQSYIYNLESLVSNWFVLVYDRKFESVPLKNSNRIWTVVHKGRI